jgi:TRAP-type C4-dicarboxylate transport system permease large subunit
MLGPLAIVLALALLGLPLFCVLGAIGLIGLHYTGTNLAGALADVYRLAGAEAVSLSTIPLFTFAGYLMARAGTAQRLVGAAECLLGWLPGGLAVVTLWTCAFFTIFTGASGVTIVALGGLLLPELEKVRYPKRFALEVVTGSGAIGLLFPPALPLIVYGIVYGINAGQAAEPGAPLAFQIDRFFMAGIVPGLLILGILTIYCIVMGWRAKVPRAPFHLAKLLATFGCPIAYLVLWFVPRLSADLRLEIALAVAGGGLVWACVVDRHLGKALWELKWEAPIPFVILLLLARGLAVIPEVAALTALYVFVIEAFVYRDIDLRRDLFGLTRESMTLVGAIFMKIAAATILTAYFVDSSIPERLFDWLAVYVHTPRGFLLVLNVVLLLVGCLMDIFSAIVVVVPLIVPAAAKFHIDPYHLGVIFLINLEIGYLLPPAGLNLFIAAFRFNRPITQLYRAVIPFILLIALALGIVTYFPRLIVLPDAPSAAAAQP